MAMIENSQRGITLNKSLAYTVAVGLITAGVWVGANLATLTSRVDDMAMAMGEARSSRGQIEGRLRAVETDGARQSAEFMALSRTIMELKEGLRENTALVRELNNKVLGGGR